ncbi:uncharacterized protein EAE98_009374 [Botrytis deweyae]|uniref:Uncharacterized protein n=1 Tax=Botrytis deweyae TaxID=2478750 RepID=A0ABQ7IC18_9HELO|nr:uncharacterized protein EAE98_009374 [Botrytis deweyae]KAF7915749.1 hypothetical protein EAE99_010000 [Botrytis elliptica]KAF7919534.1 hypothetical protein EAE98_009374 [Botrytis deweyae]
MDEGKTKQTALREKRTKQHRATNGKREKTVRLARGIFPTRISYWIHKKGNWKNDATRQGSKRRQIGDFR